MPVLKWAAAAVTALFVLMNVGVVIHPDSGVAYQLLGAVLALIGFAAVVGLAISRPWGPAATVATGAANTIASVVGLLTGAEGSVIGLVVGGLGLLLGALVANGGRRTVEA